MSDDLGNYPNPNDNPYQIGAGASDEYTPATLTERPTSVVIFGILNIVFGCFAIMGLVMSGAMFLFMAFNEEAANPFMPFAGQGAMQTVFMSVSMILNAIAAVVAIFAGIGLLKMRRSGRNLSLAYAWYSIAMGIVAAVVNYFFMMEPMLAQMNQGGGGAPPKAVMIGATIFGTCLNLIYPILLLIFMNRRNVIGALK